MKYPMQRYLLIGCLFGLLCSPRNSSAVDIMGEDVGVNLDFTYATLYMWHGYDIYYGHGSFQPSVEFSVRDFYFGAWGAWPNTGGVEPLTETDLYLGYAHTFFEEERYSFTADLSYTYFAFPKHNSDIDAQEIVLSLSLDQLIPLGPSYLVPSYTLSFDWAGVQGGSNFDDGYFHTFALGYDIPIPALISTQEEQAISLTADITYGDGAFAVPPGWSHAALGASTTFEWNNIYFTPALYYQFSFEDAVNDEDEFYALFSVGYSF